VDFENQLMWWPPLAELHMPIWTINWSAASNNQRQMSSCLQWHQLSTVT